MKGKWNCNPSASVPIMFISLHSRFIDSVIILWALHSNPNAGARWRAVRWGRWADDMKESNEFRSCLLTMALSGRANLYTHKRTIFKIRTVLPLRPLIFTGAALEQSSYSGLECLCGRTAHAICVKTTFPNWQTIKIIHWIYQHLGICGWFCRCFSDFNVHKSPGALGKIQILIQQNWPGSSGSAIPTCSQVLLFWDHILSSKDLPPLFIFWQCWYSNLKRGFKALRHIDKGFWAKFPDFVLLRSRSFCVEGTREKTFQNQNWKEITWDPPRDLTT